MVRLITTLLSTCAMSVGAEVASCSAADGSCGVSAPSMVQMKSKRGRNQALAKKRCDSDKIIEVNAHYSDDAGRDAVKGHSVDGTASDQGAIHVETLRMTDCEFQEALANPEPGVTYEEASTTHVLVHEMHEVFTSQGSEETPYGIDMVKTAQIPQGNFNVKVCVIDTGYRLGHEDLPDATHGVSGTNTQSGSWDEDGHGHGTHCAGTIGAIGNNGIGVDSCNSNPNKFTFHIGKGLSNSGSGSTTGVLAAVDGCVEAGAKIISMSLGGGGFGQSSFNAYKEAYESGVLIIAAAGNSGNSALGYPASYPHVMSVAAIDENKNKADFSQYNDQVEIAAPGVRIRSTVSGGLNGVTNQYQSMSGTSMACPHVAGVAARVWSNFPNCTNHQIRGALLKSAENLGEGECNNKYGAGLVNAEAAYNLLLAGGCEAGGAALGESPGGCEQLGHLIPIPAPTPEPACPNDCGVYVQITTDNYPAENSWMLKDASGAEVESADSFANPGSHYEERVCLDLASTYGFTITDEYSDGMCCTYGTGGYKILSVNGVELAAGGEFGASEVKLLDTSSFCGGMPSQPAPTPGTEQPVPSPGPEPTPPSGDEMCQGTCDSRAFEVAMEVHSDAAEAVWELKDSSGASVATGKGLTQDGTVREHKSCIGGGSYTFTIFGHGDVNWKVSLDGSEQGSGMVPTMQTVSIAACGSESPTPPAPTPLAPTPPAPTPPAPTPLAPTPPAPTPPTCGVKGSGHSGLIVNGEDADRCEWKWQASLMSSSGFAFCGGTLIDPEWVLTAAHCTAGSSPGSIFVKLGDYNKRNDGGVNEQKMSVVAIVDHPSYNSATMDFDISLLKLSSPVEINDCVDIACLPTEDIADGSTCHITGWGTLSSGGSSPSILQEAAVNIVSNSQCNNNYGAGKITSNMLCAQGMTGDGRVTDACQGDSGGPLVCESNGRWTVHGATSWGRGCASAAYPGVWARVYHEMAWINSKLAATGGLSYARGQSVARL